MSQRMEGWMSRRMGRIMLPRVLCLCLVFCIYAVKSHAATRDDNLFPSLVAIVASGEDPNGVPYSSQTTGFVISSDGLVLTTYHLLSDLPQTLVLSSLKISFAIADRQSSPITTDLSAIVAKDLLNDVLLFRIPSPAHNRQNLCFLPASKDNTIMTNSTPIYTSGFPAAVAYVTFSGVDNFPGPGNTEVVSLNIGFKGQSGSPIYTEKGEIIGMAKGEYQVDNQPLYLMIPSRAIRVSISPYMRDCEADFDIAGSATGGTNPTTVPTGGALSGCVFLGKLSGLTTRSPEDAPFGIDTLEKVVSPDLQSSIVKQQLTVTTDVNLRANCPVDRAGSLYYGSLQRVLHTGDQVRLDLVISMRRLGDVFFYGTVAR